MNPPVLAAIALGSNLGDRSAWILAGVEGIALLPLTSVVALSQVIETEPVGSPDQGMYLNAAVTIHTSLDPADLLGRLLAIERGCGRVRPAGASGAARSGWGPRTLDLDLLLYADRVIEVPGLRVPHPRMRERPFVLTPLAEIAPDLMVPASDGRPAATVARWRAALP